MKYTLHPICIYAVTGKNRVNPIGDETFGMLYYAEISELGKLPDSEMDCIYLMETLPENWTYPDIQPVLDPKSFDCGYVTVAGRYARDCLRLRLSVWVLFWEGVHRRHVCLMFVPVREGFSLARSLREIRYTKVLSFPRLFAVLEIKGVHPQS